MISKGRKSQQKKTGRTCSSGDDSFCKHLGDANVRKAGFWGIFFSLVSLIFVYLECRQRGTCTPTCCADPWPSPDELFPRYRDPRHRSASTDVPCPRHPVPPASYFCYKVIENNIHGCQQTKTYNKKLGAKELVLLQSRDNSKKGRQEKRTGCDDSCGV